MSGLHHWYRFQYLWVLIKQRIINFFPLQPAQGRTAPERVFTRLWAVLAHQVGIGLITRISQRLCAGQNLRKS